MSRTRLWIFVLTLALASSISEAAPAPSLDQLIETAYANHWDQLPIGERVGRFGQALEGIPYVGGTLEGSGPEVCRITTSGFDCVTFMELALDLARVTQAGSRKATPADVTAAVTYTRYRNGRLDGYLSRLHYTSEWITDNVRKGVVDDVTPTLGDVAFPLRVNYMSTHPQLYPALRMDPALVERMRRIENRINSGLRTQVPKDRVAAIESQLQTGDLVCIAASEAGLDYTHSGIIIRDGAAARLLHASSKKGRVVLDERISAYLAHGSRSLLGITVLRPRPVTAP